MKLIYEKSAGRGAAPAACRSYGPARAARCPRRSRASEPPRLPEVAEPEIVRHFTERSSTATSASTRASTRSAPAR